MIQMFKTPTLPCPQTLPLRAVHRCASGCTTSPTTPALAVQRKKDIQKPKAPRRSSKKIPRKMLRWMFLICCFLCWFDSWIHFVGSGIMSSCLIRIPFFLELALKKTSMNHKNGLTGPLEVSTKKMDEMMFRSWLRPKRRHPCLVFSTIET